MKQFSLLAVALVLVGAGCMATPTPTPAPTPAPDGGSAAGTQLEGTPQVNDTPGAKIMPPTRAEDAVYTVDGTPITMRDGKGMVLDAPDATGGAATSIFGTPVKADLDGDGDLDAALFLQRETDGSGTFYYAAIAINEDGYFQGSDAVLLGDRIAPDTIEPTKGKITFNYADRKKGEPMTTQPSVGVSRSFTVEKNQLKEVK